MLTNRFTAREEGALALAIGEIFASYTASGLTNQDKQDCKSALAAAWKWMENQGADPDDICRNIDGDPSIFERYTEFEEGTQEADILSAVFLAVGLVAFWACEEAGEMASPSVENFGEDQWEALMDQRSALASKDRNAISELEGRLSSGGDPTGYGSPVSKQQVMAGVL